MFSVLCQLMMSSMHHWSSSSSQQGVDLTLAAGKADVRVWVGSEPCNVTLLSPSQIACEPPPTQPAGVDAHGNPDSEILPLVVVSGFLV